MLKKSSCIVYHSVRLYHYPCICLCHCVLIIVSLWWCRWLYNTWRQSIRLRGGNHLLLRSGKMGRHHVHCRWGANDCCFRSPVCKKRGIPRLTLSYDQKGLMTWESPSNTMIREVISFCPPTEVIYTQWYSFKYSYLVILRCIWLTDETLKGNYHLRLKWNNVYIHDFYSVFG